MRLVLSSTVDFFCLDLSYRPNIRKIDLLRHRNLDTGGTLNNGNEN